jgi:hypothetical protein
MTMLFFVKKRVKSLLAGKQGSEEGSVNLIAKSAGNCRRKPR